MSRPSLVLLITITAVRFCDPDRAQSTPGSSSAQAECANSGTRGPDRSESGKKLSTRLGIRRGCTFVVRSTAEGTGKAAWCREPSVCQFSRCARRHRQNLVLQSIGDNPTDFRIYQYGRRRGELDMHSITRIGSVL